MTIELERATDVTVLLQSEANCYWGMGGGGGGEKFKQGESMCMQKFKIL